jgi:hypothetical protein
MPDSDHIGDKVLEMPPGFKLMGSSDSCPIAAMTDEERKFYALQFHPEVTQPRAKPSSAASCAKSAAASRTGTCRTDCLALELFRKQPSFTCHVIPPIGTSYLSEVPVMLGECHDD